VNGNGAYEGEMNEVALFENALRAAVPTRPSPAIGTALVPRLAEVARAATLDEETHATRRSTAAPRSRFALVARVGIAVALIPLVLAGLAFAGVHVPGPARDAFKAVGISLPNQPAQQHAKAQRHGKGVAGDEAATSTETTTGTTTKGNSSAAHQHALEQHAKAKGKALGHEQGKAIGLNDATPPGQANKPSHPSHPSNSGGNAGGNSATHTTTHPTHTTPNGNGNDNANANGHAK
jgi:hypothetical protein